MATQEQIDQLEVSVKLRADWLRRVLTAAQKILSHRGTFLRQDMVETVRRVEGVDDFTIELSQKHAGPGYAVLSITCLDPTETVGQVLKIETPGIFSTTTVLMHGVVTLDEREGLQGRLVVALENNLPSTPERKTFEPDQTELDRRYRSLVEHGTRLGLKIE